MPAKTLKGLRPGVQINHTPHVGQLVYIFLHSILPFSVRDCIPETESKLFFWLYCIWQLRIWTSKSGNYHRLKNMRSCKCVHNSHQMVMYKRKRKWLMKHSCYLNAWVMLMKLGIWLHNPFHILYLASFTINL